LHPVAYNYRADKQREAFIKVEYGEDDPKYDRTMTVSAINLDSTNTRYVKRMKVFFGQKGDVVFLYGNFNMPNAYVLSVAEETRGRSWSFKAKNNVKENIAVALCGLPVLTVNTVDKIWSDYSMDKVLKRQIMTLFPNMPGEVVDTYVSDAVGIAYFDGNGFVSNDKDNPDPAKFTSSFIDMSDVNPWPPASIETISIGF